MRRDVRCVGGQVHGGLGRLLYLMRNRNVEFGDGQDAASSRDVKQW
jgi:hypothetical protein